MIQQIAKDLIFPENRNSEKGNDWKMNGIDIPTFFTNNQQNPGGKTLFTKTIYNSETFFQFNQKISLLHINNKCLDFVKFHRKP